MNNTAPFGCRVMAPYYKSHRDISIISTYYLCTQCQSGVTMSCTGERYQVVARSRVQRGRKGQGRSTAGE